MPLDTDEHWAVLENARSELFELKETLEPLSTPMKRRLIESIRELATMSRVFNAGRPISRLPQELLSDVFEEVVTTDEATRRFPGYAGEPERYAMNIEISHVCQRWRAVALGTPKLWRRVHANLQTHPDALSAIVERSGRAPLDIFVNFYDGRRILGGPSITKALVEVNNSAIRHSGRAHSMTILFSTDMIPFIEWPTTPNSVESLEIIQEADYPTEFPSQDLSRVYPRLRSFTGQGINDLAAWTLPSTLTSLELCACKISANLRRFVETLGTLALLQKLSMTYVGREYEESPATKYPRVSLPRVRTLHIITDDEVLLSVVLSHISFPRPLEDIHLFLDGIPEGNVALRSCLAAAGQLARSSFPSIPRAQLVLDDFTTATFTLTVEGMDGRKNQDQEMCILFSVKRIFPLLTASPYIQTLLANLPLSEVRTARLSGTYVSWLCEQTKELLIKTGTLTVVADDECDRVPIRDLLRVSHTGNVPFRALRTLILRNMDMADLVADEVCTTARSRPMPGDMTLSLMKCRNVRRKEIDQLEKFMTVLWDEQGEVEVEGETGVAPKWSRRR